MISSKDIELVHHCLDFAKANGAAKARVELNRSVENLISILDSQIDKITRCQDSSMNISIFADGKYGSFSTNMISRCELEDFILRAIDMVRMMAPDACRNLPEKGRCCKTALSGNELGAWDNAIQNLDIEKRKTMALSAAIYPVKTQDYELVSEEGEYSDSAYDTYMADTQGMHCRHRENCFDYGVEVTIQDRQGDKYSGYWWTSAEHLKDFDPKDCGKTALQRAAAQIGSGAVKGGCYNCVVDSEVASKFVSPLLNALGGYSLQQHDSFLEGSMGKKIFSEGLTLLDLPHIQGSCCSKLFDSEGVATQEGPIIEKGVVKKYFLSTYMAAKMSLEPSNDSATRPKLEGWPVKGLDKQAIMQMCKDGILITDFNGGNCNSATGDFSYGVEGFLFRDGKIVKPISEMLVTGNFLELWNNLIACGEDSRNCMSKLIPTLAFSNVNFSG